MLKKENWSSDRATFQRQTPCPFEITPRDLFESAVNLLSLRGFKLLCSMIRMSFEGSCSLSLRSLPYERSRTYLIVDAILKRPQQVR